MLIGWHNSQKQNITEYWDRDIYICNSFLDRIFIWAVVESDQEYERQFGEDSSNIKNEDELAENITTKFLDNKVYYKVGKIEEIKDNKIYFSDNDKNKYMLENSEQINYIMVERQKNIHLIILKKAIILI